MHSYTNVLLSLCFAGRPGRLRGAVEIWQRGPPTGLRGAGLLRRRRHLRPRPCHPHGAALLRGRGEHTRAGEREKEAIVYYTIRTYSIRYYTYILHTMIIAGLEIVSVN